MRPYETMAAILRLWPQLPDLAGPRWPALYWQLADLLRDYAGAAGEAEQAAVVIDILQLLRGIPAVGEALQTEITERSSPLWPGDQGFAGAFLPATASSVRGEVEQILAPPGVTRYTDLQVPSSVQAGQRFPVIVGLTAAPQVDSADVQALPSLPGQAVRVTLTPSAGLEVLSERVKELRVEAERDSEPVVFYLRAPQPGRYSLVLDFWASGELVLSSQHSLDAIAAPVAQGVSPPAPRRIDAASPLVPHPDLILRITTEDNRLHYDLHFADTSFHTIEGERLAADPETFRYNLIREIEALAKDKKQSPGLLAQRIEQIGQRLYRQLFPPALRREYRRFSASVHTLLVISDEPWIPWELIRPYDDDELPVLDHDFLCLQFEFARWFTPARPPAASIKVDSLACIVPTDSRLDAAQAEAADMQALAVSQRILDRSPAEASYSAVVQDLLRGAEPVRLWHFACHGTFLDDMAGKSPLWLQKRQALTPDDVVGPAQTRLKTDQPLVFLNACRAGQPGLALTGMGGWAKVMVQDCGVGAFLAPMWEVDDALARAFAQAFYQRLQQGQGCTLGYAVREARRQVQQEAPHNPVWLAYSLYAHPNARVALGA